MGLGKKECLNRTGSLGKFTKFPMTSPYLYRLGAAKLQPFIIRARETALTTAETFHRALTQIILSSVWRLEWEAMCWQKVTCSKTAGKPDSIFMAKSKYPLISSSNF